MTGDLGSGLGVSNPAAATWLRNTFGNEPVPKFKTSSSVDHYVSSKMRKDGALQNSIESYKKFKSEWTAALSDDSEQMRSVFDAMNLSPQRGTHILASPEAEILAELASALSISDVEDSNFILALTDLMLEKEKTTSQIELLTTSVESRRKDLIKGLEMIKDLEQVNAQLESWEAEMQKTSQVQVREKKFLAQKISKYKSDKKKLDVQLLSSGTSAEITHPRLVADANDLATLRARLHQVEQNLDMYASLPPDKSLAQVKLALAKSDLHDLDDELSKEIESYHI